MNPRRGDAIVIGQQEAHRVASHFVRALAFAGVALLLASLAACGGGRKAVPVATIPEAPRPEPGLEAAEPPEPAPEIEPADAAKLGLPDAEDSVTAPPRRRPRRAAAAPVRIDLFEVFEARQYRSDHGQVLPYRLYRPRDYDPRRSYPLVLVLHGASARGSDNNKQLTNAHGEAAALWADPDVQRRFPAFVVVPQADPRYAPTWVRAWRNPEPGNLERREPLELAIELVGALQQEFSIDERRLYVSGYSMGAFGTWIAISRHPGLFSAAVAVAGGGDPAHVAETMTPVWAFHGSSDRIVPPGRSRQMVDALRRAGKQVRYTELRGLGHDIAPEAFAEPGLAEWLFEQRKPVESAHDVPAGVD